MDAIRTVGALIVVIFHWQMFYYPNDVFTEDGYNKAALPWYNYLSVIYDDASVVVDLFFLMSGFVLFWLYAESIAQRKVSFGKYMVTRMSRLYPVHSVTLVAVAVFQGLMLRDVGHYFVIQYNDLYHFMLNIFFMQTWGFEKGPSFNGPSWSVSVEVVTYLIFFLLCLMKWQRKMIVLAGLVMVGLLFQAMGLLFGKAIYCFFLGAIIYYIYLWLIKTDNMKKGLKVLAVITISMYIMIAVVFYYPPVKAAWVQLMQHFIPDRSAAFYTKSFNVAKNLLFRSTASPVTVLFLVVWEAAGLRMSKRWNIFGNASFGIYLMHFPLMILTILSLEWLGLKRDVMHHPAAMILFLLVLVSLSIVVYYRFELPVQNSIRKWYANRKLKTTIPEAPVILTENIP
ncbi:acyltransferase family protein [Chitinophaga solisilvae]|uniref:Acyltransferase n=1 Tax=Chitinophaga solisilvae TaxID=1233460 RepID=A0A9Q5D879_9BACT|nr:acyltransferase [Chitinophaga solisilvae]NSL85350.1 acyltransferase [Chitinophaga solisilvae]